jgi:hypothetical protein
MDPRAHFRRWSCREKGPQGRLDRLHQRRSSVDNLYRARKVQEWHSDHGLPDARALPRIALPRQNKTMRKEMYQISEQGMHKIS